MYNNKYISTKIKIYNDNIHTEFKYKKILEDNNHCKYILIEPKDRDCYEYLFTLLIDSILGNSTNKHYPQIFLEKCLCAVDKKVSLGKYIDKSNDKS